MFVGIFGRNIDAAYGSRAAAELLQPPTAGMAATISSPWSPQDTLVTFAIDALPEEIRKGAVPLSRETALRIPGVKRAHGIVCGMFAGIEFYQMDGDERTTEQPEWLTDSRSGVSPYHRRYGVASDLFFYGWALLGFTEDRTDCLHIPFGLWKVDEDTGAIIIDERVPDEYHAHPVAIPLGYGDNGLLVDGLDTLKQARKIEAAYQDRLDNPVPLTVLTLRGDIWDSWSDDERAAFRNQWNEGRSRAGGSTALKPDYVTVDMPGQVQVDLYETGRNAIRLDVANHAGIPASMIEGVRQGGSGGGTEMRYTGVQNGASRAEAWDYGLPKRITQAFEARLSLDDVCAAGLSIRGDLSFLHALPQPTTNPTSED